MSTRLEEMRKEYERNKQTLDNLRMKIRDINDKLKVFEREGLDEVVARAYIELTNAKNEYNILYRRQKELSLRIKEEEIRETEIEEEKRLKKIKKELGFKIFSPIKSFRTFISSKYITKDIPIAELQSNKRKLESELRYYREYSSYIDDEIQRVKNEFEKDKSRYPDYDIFPNWVKRDFERKYIERIKKLESLKRKSDENVRRIERLIEDIDKKIESNRKSLLKKVSGFVRDFERTYEKVRNLSFLDPKIALQIRKSITKEYWREREREYGDLLNAKRLRSQKPYIRRVNPIVRLMYSYVRASEKRNKLFNRYSKEIGFSLGAVSKLKDTYTKNQKILEQEFKAFKKTEEDIKGWQREEILFELNALYDARDDLNQIYKELETLQKVYGEMTAQLGEDPVKKLEIAIKAREQVIRQGEKEIERIKKSDISETEKKREIIRIRRVIFELEKELAQIRGQYDMFTSGIYYTKHIDVEKDYEDIKEKRVLLRNRIKYLEWKLRQIEEAEKKKERVERVEEEQEEIINDLKQEAQDAKNIRREIKIQNENIRKLLYEINSVIEKFRG